MKNPNFIALILLIFTVIGCRKREDLKNLDVNHNTASSGYGIYVENGIPIFTNREVYITTLELLTDELLLQNSELYSLYSEYNTDSACSTDTAWALYQLQFAPLQNFELSLGEYTSLRSVEFKNEKNWLQSQVAGEDLDVTNFPELSGINCVNSTLMNSNRMFVIDDTLFHIDDNFVIYEVPNWDSNQYLLDSILFYSFQGRLIEWVDEFDDKKIKFTNFNNNGNTCYLNRKSGQWNSVNNRLKYNVTNSLYYDFSKTSGYTEVRAYAKVLGVWVPAVTSVRVGIQIFPKLNAQNCATDAPQWTGQNVMYGHFGMRQLNYWNLQRSVEVALFDQNNSYPITGYWGAVSVKESTINWHKLHIAP